MGQIKIIVTDEDTPDQIINDLHTIFSDSGIVEYELIVSRAEEYSIPKQKTLFKDGFTVKFYKERDSLVSVLSAEYGEMRKEENLIIARNNVIFTNFENGKTLKTEELFWDQQMKRVKTEKRFEISDKESRIEGYGVDSDETFSDYEMHDVTGQYIFKDTAQ